MPNELIVQMNAMGGKTDVPATICPKCGSIIVSVEINGVDGTKLHNGFHRQMR